MRPAFVQLRLPRNPLVRLLLVAAGIAVLSVFALAGAALAAAALAALGLRQLWWKLRGGRPAPRSNAPSDVIEGDFTVVDKVQVRLPPQRQS